MEIETIKQLLITAAWASPLVVGITEVIKEAFKKLNSDYIPAVSVIVGLMVGLIVIDFSLTGGIVGVILGLIACGLWDVSAKTIIGTK